MTKAIESNKQDANTSIEIQSNVRLILNQISFKLNAYTTHLMKIEFESE